MCQCGCIYESYPSGDCSLKSIHCKAEIEDNIESIKKKINKYENLIEELEEDLIMWEGKYEALRDC